MPTKGVMLKVVLATLFVGSLSPPPDTVTLKLAPAGALFATFIMMLIFGKGAAAARTSERVHVRLFSVQVHPVPLIAVAVIPGSRTATNDTVPAVEIFPRLKISTEALTLVCP